MLETNTKVLFRGSRAKLANLEDDLINEVTSD